MPQPEQTPSNKSLIAGLFVFLWLGFLVGGYIWAHNPLSADIFKTSSQTLFNLLVWLALTWLAAALGLMALSALHLQEEDNLAELALAAGIGLGLVSILFSLIGFARFFTPAAAWIFVILLSLLTFRRWRELFYKLRTVLHWPHPHSKLERLIFIFAGLLLITSFIIALTPPVAWDALTYHLVGPKLYIEAGTFVHPLDIPQLGFPLLGQMHFTLGMLLAGEGTAALFHYGYGLLALALVIALAREQVGRAAAWLAALALLSVPLFTTLLSWPYVDVTLLFYTTAVFTTFYRWQQDKQTGWLVVLGLMLGFSGGLKYTAIAMSLAVTAGIVFASRRDGLLTILKRLVLVGAVALLLVLPWLLENYLTTGNPVYPFFLAEAKFWDGWRSWWYNRPGTGVLQTSPISLLLAPLEATILDGTLAGNSFDGAVGPLILGVLLLLLFVWRELPATLKKFTGYLLLFVISAYLFWLWGIARSALLLQTRLLLPVFGLFAILVGLILAYMGKWRQPQLDVGWLARVILALAVTVMILSQALNFLAVNPLPVLVGLETQDHFLERSLGTYAEVITAVNQLPPDANVQFLWEARSYHCAITCQPDPILDAWLHLTQHLDLSAADIAHQWQKQGITHVLMYDGGLQFIVEADFDPVTEADLAAWETMKATYLRPVQTWPGQYTLYELATP